MATTQTESDTPKETVVISDWYELTNGDELRQGDVIAGCPVFRPPSDMPWPLPDGATVTFGRGEQDAVVLSQSCDLVKGQADEESLVILCPVWTLDDAAAYNPYLKSEVGREECRRGAMNGFHMIAGCEHKAWPRGICIVSFQEVLSLPLYFMRKVASSEGERVCMRSPYREHLAQSFARYFMRVGLPVNLPPFTSEKNEKEILKRARVLDGEARRRVLEALGAKAGS